MKRFFISCVIVLFATGAFAADRKALADVDSDAFTTDTQVSFKGSGDDHISLAWWIPNEFWESLFARDTSTSDAEKKSMLDALSDVSLLAIVQADVTDLGAFNFYSKDEVEGTMKLSYLDADGKKHKMKTMKKINSDLTVVLAIFKPILGAAMGNLGNNMHFYVLSDKSRSFDRLLNPYRKGKISIQLKRRDKKKLNADIGLPLNSLYIPRECSNGKEAHVSWTHCPWGGERLNN